MLRALLLVAVPFAGLLAATQAPVKAVYPAYDPQAKIVLAKVPIEEAMKQVKANELAKLKAAAEDGDLEAQARLG